MRVAKAKGHLRGKQPKLSVRQEAHLVELIRSGEYTTSEVGDLFGVARSTVYRALQRSKQRAALASVVKTSAPRVRPAPGEPQPMRTAASSPDGVNAYRPRHGASTFPPVKRARRSTTPRQSRPEPAPQTQHLPPPAPNGADRVTLKRPAPQAVRLMTLAVQ